MNEPATQISSRPDGNDQLLIERARQGDRRAFDLIVLKYQSRLQSVLTRLVGNPSDALDVLQDTFVKAYRSLHTFRGESALYTWLYRIAVNTAKNHLVERNKTARDLSLDEDGFDPDPLPRFQDLGAPEAMASADQMQAVILHAIEALPEDLKMALTLRELEGMSYEEIAETQGCPIGTVRSRIFRAREQIVQLMAEQFPGTFL